MIGAGSNALSVFLGNGDGTFGTGTSYGNGSGSYLGMEVGDFNNDGNLDVVSVGQNGTDGIALVFLGSGNGTFTSIGSFIAENNLTFGVTVADVRTPL